MADQRRGALPATDVESAGPPISRHYFARQVGRTAISRSFRAISTGLSVSTSRAASRSISYCAERISASMISTTSTSGYDWRARWCDRSMSMNADT